MTTERSERDPELTRRASSFGSAAARYGANRPDYPATAIRWALTPAGGGNSDRDGAGSGIRVLDLAAGTGRLSEALLAAGLDVVAVEPDGQMRAEMTRRLPGVTALAGTAEDIPLAGGEVDAVLAGQAFHWFDQQRALPEIARVLRPGGVLAALWNTDDTRVPWVTELAEVSGFGQDRRGIPPIIAHPAFRPVEWASFDHAYPRTAESLLATVSTYSAVLTMEPGERADWMRRIREFLASRPETADGEFDLPLITSVGRAVRR